MSLMNPFQDTLPEPPDNAKTPKKGLKATVKVPNSKKAQAAKTPKQPKQPKQPKLKAARAEKHPKAPKPPKPPKAPKQPKKSKAKLNETPADKSDPIIKTEDADDGPSVVENSLPIAEEEPDTELNGELRRIQEDEVAVTLALNAEDDIAVRVARKEKCATMGIAFLGKLKPLLEKDVTSVREMKSWARQCDEVIHMGETPRILVGVLGYTGSGKSSLINSLLDYETIVPCNSFRASTSVAVEIAYNLSDDPKEAFLAEIEFIDKDEWTEEFNILVRDIKDEIKDRSCSSEPLTLKSGSDASLAWAKLSAVYPGLPIEELVKMTPNQLEKIRDLSTTLGLSNYVSEGTAQKFSQAVSKYIDSSNSADGVYGSAYWPLVRKVKLQIRSEILKHGLVLVDLPGLGDSNIGRTQVAEEYIKHLQHIWIVADIVRAVDDKVANELMSRSFKRQLLMDGRLHQNFVTFIMTKTDVITTDEAIKSLNLAEGVLKLEVQEETRLMDQLQDFNNQLRECKKQHKRLLLKSKNNQGEDLSSSASRKRSHEEIEAEIDTPMLSTESQEIVEFHKLAAETEASLRLKISCQKRMISALNTKMKSICIKERNKYTQEALDADFKQGCKEFRQELLAEGDHTLDHASEETNKWSLNTFCVSSKAYQRLCGRFRRDNSVKGFGSLDDTNIPSLKLFAGISTLSDRERVADKVLTEINLFKITLELWAENRGTTPTLSRDQKESLIAAVNRHSDRLKTAIEKHKHNTNVNMRNAIKNHIEKHFANAVVASCTEASTVSSDRGVPYQTWRAICRKGGIKYSTGKKVSYHWNEEYTNPFLSRLAERWDDVFRRRIPNHNKKYADHINDTLVTFVQAIDAEITNHCGKYHMLHNKFKQVPILADQVRMKVLEALRAGQSTANDTHRDVTTSIIKDMGVYYKLAVDITGSGALKKLQSHLIEFNESNAPVMYNNAVTIIRKGVAQMRLVLRQELLAVARQAHYKLKKDMLRMIRLGAAVEEDSGSVATADLREAVKEHLTALDDAWATELQDPTTQLRAHDQFQIILPNYVPLDDESDGVDGSDEGESESEDEWEDDSETMTSTPKASD